MTTKQIPLIIPSLEPDDRLTQLLAELRQEGIENIVLVDDGSGPAYRPYFDDAEAKGCVVLRHAVNLGKGRALKNAFNYCLLRWPEAPGCVTADSDGQHTPACILACMEALAAHPDHLILGCRDFDAEGVPSKSRMGNKLTCLMFRYLVGLKIGDTQTGLRGISREYMKKLLSTQGERFEFESNMLIDTKEAGVPITEVPILTVYDSKENHSTHFHPVRDSLRISSIFGKFLFSSLSSSVVDLLLFSLFCRAFPAGLWGIGYISTATVLARILSATYNYLLNHRVVFKSKEGYIYSALKYAALAAVQMFCSAWLVTHLYGLIGGPEELTKILVDTFLFFISFQIQREFVYKRR